MRTAFINALVDHARSNERIFLVVGDLGFSVVEAFAREFPDRFLNAGVAEQNMTGLAAGLASEGYHVFTYSIANFPTLRCLEQIRNDICYHDLPVTVVSVGAGMAYGNLGYSHHAVQDIAALRGLPNMTVLSPADPGETTSAIDWIASHPGPSYLRLGKAGEKLLTEREPIHKTPRKVLAQDGAYAIVATGSILSEALDAAKSLINQGQLFDVFSCPWLAPVVAATFSELAGYKRVFVVEEHVRQGGLGEMIASYLSGCTVVENFSVPVETAGEVGSQDYLRARAGLDAKGLTTRITALIIS